jgi:type I restriction enzyme, S subunit
MPVETVKPELEPGVEFVYIDISSIDREQGVVATPHHLVGAEAPQRARQRVRADDILMSTVRPNLRTIVVVPGELNGQIASTGFCVIRPSPELAPRFLYQAILCESFQRRVEGKARGVNYPAVRDDDILDETIRLPPYAEQVRIVEAVDRAMAAIADGKRSLQLGQRQLRDFVASLLAAAVTGRLPDLAASDSAADLLDRILERRRQQWEQTYLAKHPTPRDDRWKARYREPAQPDENLHSIDLAEGWVWATVDQLAGRVEYGSSTKTDNDITGTPVLRMANIIDGRLDLAALKYLPADHHEFPQLLLERGDMLFTRTNGSVQLVGKSAVYSGEPEVASYASYLVRFRPLSGYRSELLAWFLNSPYGRRWARSVSSQVGQANINSTKLRQLTVPLPPEKVQEQIIAAVESWTRAVDALQGTIKTALDQAAMLRRGVLDRAQEGAVVPQQPTDEPAKKLLERIRADRPAEPPRRQRRRPAVASTGY